MTEEQNKNKKNVGMRFPRQTVFWSQGRAPCYESELKNAGNYISIKGFWEDFKLVFLKSCQFDLKLSEYNKSVMLIEVHDGYR